MMVTITDSAQEYLRELLDKQDDDVVGIRIFVNQYGTAKAETCVAYCREDDIEDSDEKIEYDKFPAYFDGPSLPYLEEALVDYSKDRMGGQLTIKAPNSKIPKVNADSPMADRINYILYNEINPSLASHGGEVSLMEVTENNVAILQFGGGCQGCGMVGVTLKNGVEKSLLEQLPDLKGVSDVTDHTDRANAYY